MYLDTGADPANLNVLQMPLNVFFNLFHTLTLLHIIMVRNYLSLTQINSTHFNLEYIEFEYQKLFAIIPMYDGLR